MRPRLPQTSKMESFATLINDLKQSRVETTTAAKYFALDVSGSFITPLVSSSMIYLLLEQL